MINTATINLIKKWEGYHKRLPDGRCQAYLDTLVRPALRSPGYKGLWTIGYGCTEGVTEGLIWTEKQAEAALRKEIAKHEAQVDRLLVGLPTLNENQRGALVSLSYNVGPGWVARSSVLRYIKQGDFEKAAASFVNLNKAGGRSVKGLTNRRRDEAKLFMTPPIKEVVQASRKIRWSERLRNTFGGLSLAGIFSWNTLHEVRQFATDHAGLILLGLGVSAFLIFQLFKNWGVQDYEEGRYTPSGLATESEGDE